MGTNGMRYRFRDVEIDEDSFTIWRGGTLVHVEPKVFEFVAHLIRHRERVVLKSELLQSVWNGYTVGESALHRCVCVARQLLGNSNAIRTVHGRGYQWVGEVGTNDTGSDAPSNGGPI